MAGHSHASNIKHRKNAVDSKKAKLFTKTCKDLYVCAKAFGIDSPRLKMLIEQARKIDLPRENIERAIFRATNNNNVNDMQEIIYEAFAQNIALIIKVYTDNKNRAASNIRAILNKHNAALGSCLYLFAKQTHIHTCISLEKLLNIITADFIDILPTSDGAIIVCELENTQQLEKECEQVWVSTQIVYHPFETITCKAKEINDLIEALEKIEDVECVWSNCKIDI